MAIADPPQVSIGVSTIEEITDQIASARQRGSEPFLSFHWQASQAHDLFGQLNARMAELLHVVHTNLKPPKLFLMLSTHPILSHTTISTRKYGIPSALP
jgi:hypothetical protein